MYQELSPIDLNKVGAVVQLFNNNTGTGYIIETKRQCGQYLNIRAYHDDDKVGRWQIISKASFRDQFYNNDKLIAKVTVSDCRLSTYGVQTCSLRQYWPRQRFYCSILPPAAVSSETAPCLRSYNIKNGSLDGWCYLKPGTVNGRFNDIFVQDEAVDTLRGKASGLYNEGVLVEAMD